MNDDILIIMGALFPAINTTLLCWLVWFHMTEARRAREIAQQLREANAEIAEELRKAKAAA